MGETEWTAAVKDGRWYAEGRSIFFDEGDRRHLVAVAETTEYADTIIRLEHSYSPSDAEQLIRLRKAATVTLEWLDAEITARQCYGHDQPTHCVECALRHKAINAAMPLRKALNPSHSQEKETR